MARPLAIRVPPEQRFGCSQCARCCRGWHVAINAKEIEGLRKHDWQGDPHVPAAHDPVTVIDDQTYLAHKPTGECIYLDPETLLCRVEVRFGHAAKPLGCRLFPYHVTAVSKKMIACSARFDCPSVQQNHGPLLTEQREQIVKLAREMQLRGQADEEPLDGLQPDTAVLFAESFAGLFNGNDPCVASMALLLAARHFDGLGPDFLNDRPTMREILPPLLAKFCQRAEETLAQAKPPGAIDRVLFHLWLAGYLRRDEELIGQPFGRRVERMLDLLAILLGGGNLRKLGPEHPEVALRKAGLFAGRNAETSSAAWDCWRRFAQGRLQTLQFFGSSLNGENFFSGAQKLATLFALVSAAAKISAAAAGRADRLEKADVEYAVGAISHSFGRSALLRLPPQRFVERHFLNPDRLACVLQSLHSAATSKSQA